MNDKNWANLYKLRGFKIVIIKQVNKKSCSPNQILKFVHFKKPVTGSSFLSKSVVIFTDFVLISAKMTALFKRNEDRVTGFLK